MDPYRDSIEHLTDELKRVDLLIQRAMTIALSQGTKDPQLVVHASTIARALHHE